MTDRVFTEDEIRQAAWDAGMRLRNSLYTWATHPTFESKENLKHHISEVWGAHLLLQTLVPYDLTPVAQLYRWLRNVPGQDREYRERAYQLALEAFPPQQKEN